MPAYQELLRTGALDLPAVRPVVRLGMPIPGLSIVRQSPGFTCLTAERRLGVTPGTASFRFDKNFSGGFNNTSPVTLNAAVETNGYTIVDPGTRVTVSIDEVDVWRGWITRRQDQGETDSVIWYALEDQFLLSKVFMRGALVWDETAKKPKYVESMTPFTNPNGLWNCLPFFYDAGSVEMTGYCFAPYAKKQMNYESPEGTDVGTGYVNPNDKTKGFTYCAWTPRRFLQYVKFMAYTRGVRGADGIGEDQEGVEDSATPLASLDRRIITLRSADIDGLIGFDPADITNPVWGTGTDPLDRKLPSVNFQGVSVGHALDITLKAAGTHDLVLNYAPNDATYIQFAPIRWSGDQSGTAKELTLQRAGTVASSSSAYGFDVVEDCERYAEMVVVDGAPIKVETRLACLVKADGTVDTENSEIIPAWSVAEQEQWSRCVSGRFSRTGDPAKYALFPKKPGSLDPDDLIGADGTLDGTIARPSALPRSPAAFQMASQNFPTVFRAFRLNTPRLLATGALDGFEERYKNKKRWAKLNYNRPLYAEQLQFLLNDLGASATDQVNWLRGYLPIRVSTKIGDKWTDIQYQKGVRTTGDGLIWLEQFTLQAASNWDSILGVTDEAGKPDFDNRMDWPNAWRVSLRSFALNAALPLDGRVTGVVKNMNAVALGKWGFHEDMRIAVGPPMAYFDQPEAYQEHNQFNSQPTANPKYVGSNGTEADWPLDRLVPPGSERASAQYQAIRKLRYLNAPVRTSSWRLPWINLNWAPGDFLKEVKCVGTGVTEAAYAVNAAVPRVTYDFMRQRTDLGGIVSDMSQI